MIAWIVAGSALVVLMLVLMSAVSLTTKLEAQRDEFARLYVSAADADAPSEYRGNKARLIAEEARVNNERN